MVTRMKTASRGLQLLAFSIVLLRAASASADENRAERLFREGRAFMLEGRFDEACPMLAESQKLEPHVGTLLNLAACHERQGKVGSAWVEYQKALTAARAEGQSERAQLAEQRITALEPRVPWLRISSSADDVSITLDGGALEHVAWGKELPVDPGVHLVVAERRGASVFEERVELREGDHRNVSISAAPVDAAAPPSDVGRLVVEPKPPEDAAAPKPAKGRWVLELGLFVGYIGGSAARQARITDPGSVALVPTTSANQPTTCANQSCQAGEIENGGGLGGGVNLFVGYAISDQVNLGLRVLGAPMIASAGAWAFGPSVSFHATDTLTIGGFGLFGNASFKGEASPQAPRDFSVGTSRVRVEGDIAGGFGAGLELSVRLLELRRGVVVANTTPFFLSGEVGNAFCVPVGIAYRFQ